MSPKQGWLHVGHNGSKEREIDLLNEAHKPLYAYLQATSDTARTYVFASQRSERLTEEGIYYWFRTLKAQGTRGQWESIEDLTFNDLRHDFAQRARGAGWSLEEVAYYFGDVTEKGASSSKRRTFHSDQPGATQIQAQQHQRLSSTSSNKSHVKRSSL